MSDYYFDNLPEKPKNYLYVYIDLAHKERFYSVYNSLYKIDNSSINAFNYTDAVATVELIFDDFNNVIDVNTIMALENYYYKLNIRDITFFYYD